MRTGLLIAEAEWDLRDAYGRLSSGLGFDVETAANGLECWTKLLARFPDVLIVDVEIPWGGGDGVLARLREEFGFPMAPAIFITGDEPPEILSRRSGIPAGRCFQKPFRLSALLDSVCTVVAGRQVKARTG